MALKVFNLSGFRAGWIIGRVAPHDLSATLVVKGTFRLRNGLPATPLPEEEQEELNGDVNREDNRALSLAYSSDFALMKPNVDLLFVGAFHAPAGKPVAIGRVDVAVGEWSKSLAIIGNRVWQSRLLAHGMSEPEPFTTMPIAYERAYGGPGYLENPSGIGFQEIVEKDGSRGRRLPNIELADRLIADPDVRFPPAGLGPLAQNVPTRLNKLGKLDSHWFEKNWPWFPDDFDWTFFNAAPPDQQVAALKGNESLRVINMRPDISDYAAALPSLRIRWVLEHQAKRAHHLVDVAMKLDTVWIDMDRERLLLVWRGVTAVDSAKMKSIVAHYIAVERLDEGPKSPEDIAQTAISSRTLPEDVPASNDEKLPEGFPIKGPDTDWTKQIEDDERLAKAEFEQVLDDLKAQETRVAALLKEQGILLNLTIPTGATPPGDLYRAALSSYRQLMAVDPELARALGPPERADFEEPPEPPQGEAEQAKLDEPWTRQRCEAHLKRGGSFKRQDLSELDLSGIDFHGVDFEGALLRATKLTDCDLRGCLFSQSVMTGADLTSSRLTAADLEGADLAGARLDGADLSGARLDECDLTGASLEKARLRNVSARSTAFTGANLKEAQFGGADLSSGDFEHANLDEADFTETKLEAASFQGTRGRGIRFDRALMTGARFAESELTQSMFTRVQADESIWREARLLRADFTEAVPGARSRHVPASIETRPAEVQVAGFPAPQRDIH